MNFKNKKILVTGGSGFIGVNLVDRLKTLGASVYIYDLALGYDIQNYRKLEEVLKKRFDIIFHLAGFSDSVESNKNIEKSFQLNTFATVNICQLLIKFSPQTKLILSSSRLEYGKPQYLPLDEEHPTNPISAYGLSKLIATQMALIYNKRNNLDVTIFRTSNVYGPHKREKFANYNIINHLIDRAIKSQPLTIYGNGNQERDYIYIDDLIEAFILASENQKISAGEIYNLGYGKGIKFKEMVNLILNKVGDGKAQFVPWPKPYHDVETGSYISDITKIQKQLGFTPKINFKEGIEKTIHAKW